MNDPFNEVNREYLDIASLYTLDNLTQGDLSYIANDLVNLHIASKLDIRQLCDLSTMIVEEVDNQKDIDMLSSILRDYTHIFPDIEYVSIALDNENYYNHCGRLIEGDFPEDEIYDGVMDRIANERNEEPSGYIEDMINPYRLNIEFTERN